ncbi:aminotransferase class V-fold PLP-dependent enzyme [Pedobacter sp. PWIIR3]
MNFPDQFPVLNTCTYLNTASSGLISRNQIEWRRSHDENFLNQGSGFRITQAEFLQEVKVNLSGFFNSKIENTFLVPNFSFGFNTFLSGLGSDQRILLLQEDYPSVNYAIESRGYVCDYVSLSENIEENIIKKIKEFKPSVFAFSLIQYISGIELGLDFLKTIKETFPKVLLVADGTQFCGSRSFDFEASGLDALMSSGYKWMLSGYGNGFVLLKDQAVESIYVASRKRPQPKEPFLQSRGILGNFFEPGHLDTLSFGTLNQALLFFKEIDFVETTKAARSLAMKAKRCFEERNLLSPVVESRNSHSSIFNLNIPAAKYMQLAESKIICLPRGPGIRVAFHLYNTEKDLQTLLTVLDDE